MAKPVCCKTMADVSIKNLSSPQRELIQWHSKLCINMNLVEEMMLTPMLTIIAQEGVLSMTDLFSYLLRYPVSVLRLDSDPKLNFLSLSVLLSDSDPKLNFLSFGL